MHPRIKKLIGAVAIVLWIPLYALVAMAVGVHVLARDNWVAQLAYYALAGTLWIVPIGLLLPWMHREPGRTPAAMRPK